MSEKKKSTDPKYPPAEDPDEYDPDEEESWPDLKEELQRSIKEWLDVRDSE